MHEWINCFISEGLKFICVCNSFKINGLQSSAKIDVDFATDVFILVEGFKRWEITIWMYLRKPERFLKGTHLPWICLLGFSRYKLIEFLISQEVMTLLLTKHWFYVII